MQPWGEGKAPGEKPQPYEGGSNLPDAGEELFCRLTEAREPRSVSPTFPEGERLGMPYNVGRSAL